MKRMDLRNIGIPERWVFPSRWLLTKKRMKDAAKIKTTYIVEHDEQLMRGIYEDIWAKAIGTLRRAQSLGETELDGR
jgi:hypothetical protein